METIQEYFQCEYSYITINQKTHSAELVISSPIDLKTKVIPHLEKYPVFEGKQYSFLVLKEIIERLEKNPLTRLNLAQIIKLAYNMNTVTNRKEEGEKQLLEYIGETSEIEVAKPIIKHYPIEDQFIVGFIDGDGSFHLSFSKRGKIQ